MMMEWRGITSQEETCACACTFYIQYVLCVVLCCVRLSERERERKKRPLPPPSLPPALVIPLCFGDLGNPVTKHSRGPFDWGPRVGVKFGRSEKTEEDGEQDGGGGGRGG